MRHGFLLSATIAALACTGSDDSRGAAAAGIATVFDSTGDTIVARVDGPVPVTALRTLTQVLRIAPAEHDTTLFSVVSDLVVDAAHRIWVWDSQTGTLFLFDSIGALVRRIGRRGSGPGEFSQGNGFAALSDTGLAALDYANGRLSFFNARGDLVTSWPVTSSFSTVSGLVTDRSNALYLRRPVAPAGGGEVVGRMGLVRLNDGGAFGDSLVPLDLPVTRDAYVAVSPQGMRMSAPNPFAANYHWDWHPAGYFVVAHGGTYEVILARKAGKPVVIRRALPSVPVLPAERAVERERIVWQMRRVQPGWQWPGPEITEKAPISAITVTRDGNIWVRVASPSEPIPDDELPPQRENTMPIRRHRAAAVYELFAPDGLFLGRVPMPPRTVLAEADGDLVWAVERDRDGLAAIVRYRLNAPPRAH
jgi:hypothetical protein